MKIFQFVFDEAEHLLYYYYKGEALIRKGYPFFLPKVNPQEEYVAYPSLLVRIGRTGREVAARFAHRYINGIGVGVDLVHLNRWHDLQSAGLPWEEAVAFEYASAGNLYDEVFDDEGPLPNYSVEGVGMSSVITESMMRQAVERMSRLNIIHVGDILSIRTLSTSAIPLQVENNYIINLTSDRNYTLRVK